MLIDLFFTFMDEVISYAEAVFLYFHTARAYITTA